MTIAAQAVIRFIVFAFVGVAVAYWTWAWMNLFNAAELDTFSAFVGIGIYQSMHMAVWLFGIYGKEKEHEKEEEA